MKTLFLTIILSALLPPFGARGNERTPSVPVENIQVLKISPQDERAIIRTPAGETRLIKVGDVLRVPRSELRVVEIAAERVVFEEKIGEETEMVIIRVGGSPASGTGELRGDGLKKQKIERIKKAGERQPVLLAPAITKETK